MIRRRTLKLTAAEWQRAEQIAMEHGGLPLERIFAAGLFALAEMPVEEAWLTLALSVERDPVRREGRTQDGQFASALQRAAKERLQELRNKKK